MTKKEKKLLSVIIPAYKQEKTIIADLRRIETVLQHIRHNYEIIVVVDGRVDRTYEKAKSLVSPKIKIYQYKINQGKGHAVRYGMKKAKGDYIAFIDAGMEIDPNGISMLLEHLQWYDADIIVGSKRHPASQVNYPLARKVLSIGYFWLVRILFQVKVKDTQSGIKIFRRQVLEKVLPVLLVKKYAFDVEILSVAYRFGFRKIYEAPIKIEYQFDSLTKASTLENIRNMLWETMAVFYRLNILKYYEKQACLFFSCRCFCLTHICRSYATKSIGSRYLA